MIFLPVLMQITLTLAVFIALSMAKTRATKNGQVNAARRGLYDDAWPESVLKINNNIRNQFELPVLFYVLSILLWLLNAADTFAQVIAWLFVLSRIVHAYIHIVPNTVPVRRKVFTFGFLMIFIMFLLAAKAILVH